MSKKKRMPEERWRELERWFDPNRCTISAFWLVADGFTRRIVRFERRMFDDGTSEDDGTAETQTIKGKIISQNGQFIKVNVDGEIVGIQLA